MVRNALLQHQGGEEGFRWRSTEITRIEALSDAVFAFAVTLLIVALEVPRTFHELWEIMQGFPVFCVSFGLLFYVWYLQYQFFRRYGMQDPVTLCWNGALLFVVLYFVYPLKFLFGFLWRLVTGGEMMVHNHQGELAHIVEASDVRTLMVAYGLGFVAIYVVFWMLYRRAWSRREELALTPFESRRTQHAMQQFSLDILVGLASVAAAALLPERTAGLAGFAYMTLGPAHAILGVMQGRKLRKEGLLPDASSLTEPKT